MKNIKIKYNSVPSFSFHRVSTDEVKKDIRGLKNNKSVDKEIPIQISKESDLTFDILKNCVNKSIETDCFQDSLKNANITPIFRSSRAEVFCKKGILKNFTKFTGKHLCQSLFFNKAAGNFIKKETLAQVFSCEFCKIFKNTYFYRTSPVVASSFSKETIH